MRRRSLKSIFTFKVRRYSTFEIERRYSTEVRKVQSEGTLRKKYRFRAKQNKATKERSEAESSVEGQERKRLD